MMGAKVFLTGATGVIGRRVVPALVAAAHQVTAVGRTAEKRAQLERQGARAVAVDLFDPAAARAAVRGHDVLVNLATHIPPSSQAFFPWAWRANSRGRRGGGGGPGGAGPPPPRRPRCSRVLAP